MQRNTLLSLKKPEILSKGRDAAVNRKLIDYFYQVCAELAAKSRLGKKKTEKYLTETKQDSL
jgi:hypothetical protein